jgi:hypothetical protein
MASWLQGCCRSSYKHTGGNHTIRWRNFRILWFLCAVATASFATCFVLHIASVDHAIKFVFALRSLPAPRKNRCTGKTLLFEALIPQRFDLTTCHHNSVYIVGTSSSPSCALTKLQAHVATFLVPYSMPRTRERFAPLLEDGFEKTGTAQESQT